MKPFPISLGPVVALALAGAVSAMPVTEPSADGWGIATHGPFAPAVATPEVDHQVRIEQHFSIRITPGPAAMPPEMRADLPPEDPTDRPAERWEEHRAGRCVAIGAIGAVRVGQGNRLLIFLRDQRLLAASLEKACHARDFYMGFYVERNADGMLCVARDTLQSRSGANCKLRQLAELTPAAPRR